MNKDAEGLLNEALKRVKMGGSFSPEEIGARIGLNKFQAEAAARTLANAGVLILGFDSAAHFTPQYRKQRAVAERKAHPEKKQPGERSKVASSSSSSTPRRKRPAVPKGEAGAV